MRRRRFVEGVAAAVALLSIAAAVGCGAAQPIEPIHTPSSTSPARQQRLADGLYAVIAEASTREGVSVADEPHVVLVDDGRHTGDRSRPPRWLALRTSGFVPLILEGEPHTEPDGRGHALLHVTLQRSHQQTLADFTRAQLGGSAAIVLDGEVVTVHKIRMVIEGGKMQITRCEDDACQMLRSKLVD
jgi:hypothetical protein